MRGETIVVKEFTGNAIVVRLWEVCPFGLLIHSEEEFHKRMTGEPHLDPVGFPLADCYKYDDPATAQLTALEGVQWDKLNRWEPR